MYVAFTNNIRSHVQPHSCISHFESNFSFRIFLTFTSLQSIVALSFSYYNVCYLYTTLSIINETSEQKKPLGMQIKMFLTCHYHDV